MIHTLRKRERKWIWQTLRVGGGQEEGQDRWYGIG